MVTVELTIGKILVADDEPHFRFSLALALRRRGHFVEEAAEGRDALEKARKAAREGAPFDLLVTDLQMSPVGGLELLDRLEGEGANLPVLVLSGFYDEEMIDDLVRRRCLDCLEKPIALEDLVGRVGPVLKSHCANAIIFAISIVDIDWGQARPI